MLSNSNVDVVHATRQVCRPAENISLAAIYYGLTAITKMLVAVWNTLVAYSIKWARADFYVF